MRKIIFVLFLFVIIPSTSLEESSVFVTDSYFMERRITVPFCIVLQGQERCGTALVDTGSSFTLIDSGLISGLEAQPIGFMLINMGGVSQHRSVITQMQAWANCFPVIPAQRVIVHSKLKEATTVDAIIGMDLISHIENDLTIAQLRACS